MTEQEIKNKIKNKEYIDWYYISYSQKLSEDFIRELSDKVYIKFILLYYFNFENNTSWRSFI